MAGKHLRRRGDSQHGNDRGTREKMISLHFLSPDMPRPIRDLLKRTTIRPAENFPPPGKNFRFT
jgi:hypothetical protein